MVAFLTPSEMFQEYISGNDIMKDYYLDEMQTYRNTAMAKIARETKCSIAFVEEYAKCVAFAYQQGGEDAIRIFNRLGLRLIDSSAILEQFRDFELEYDETERNEPDDEVNY